jgi:hypothetical protein
MTKRKKIMWYSIIGILFMITLVYVARPHSRIILLFWPPADLYEPLVLEPISLKEKVVLSELPLNHSYVGTYSIGIYMDNVPRFTSPIKSDAAIELSISHGGKTLFEERYNKWTSLLGAPGTKNSGVILGSYRVPDNIPLKVQAEAKITVIATDSTFENKYGNLVFFVRRIGGQ